MTTGQMGGLKGIRFQFVAPPIRACEVAALDSADQISPTVCHSAGCPDRLTQVHDVVGTVLERDALATGADRLDPRMVATSARQQTSLWEFVASDQYPTVSHFITANER